MPKAAYRSDFRENTDFCPQRDSNLGPLAQQASVLPLDHCDLQTLYSAFVVLLAMLLHLIKLSCSYYYYYYYQHVAYSLTKELYRYV